MYLLKTFIFLKRRAIVNSEPLYFTLKGDVLEYKNEMLIGVKLYVKFYDSEKIKL